MKKATLLSSMLCLVSVYYGQSKPGGVSGGNALEMWFDASKLSLNNNDPVANFTDFSGNGNNATQAMGSKQPLFKSITVNMNYKPSLYFDGTDDLLLTTAISNMNTSTQSVFVVVDMNSTASSVMLRSAYSSGAGTANESGYLWANYHTSTDLAFQLRNLDGSNITQTFPMPAGRVFTEMIWNGSTSVDFYERGNLITSIAGSDANPTGNLGFSIGGNFLQPKPYFRGWISEIIVFSKALNTAERRIVEAYLGAKYQLTVNNDLFAHDPSFAFDLIGVGQESNENTTSAVGESLSLSNPSTLGNGDYLLVAHNNAGYTPELVDVPGGFGARYTQVWKTEMVASPGSVTIAIDVSVNSLGTDPNLYELLVDADGTFSSSTTSYAGTYDAGVVTFTNVSLPDNYYFTLYNGSTDAVTSTGVTTDWHTTTTWSCGCIPSLNTDVTILTGHTVEVNSQDAEAKNLIVDGILNLNSTDTLFITGDFTNNNTFSAGTSTINLKGVINQTISSVSTLNLYNLYSENTDSVLNTATITIANKFKPLTGVFSTGNDLTLLSDASGTAGLVYPKYGNLTGNIIVQRYLNEGESWYLIAPGVKNGTLEDWNQEFEMQGFTGSDWPGGSPSVYYYNQNNNVTSYYDGYTAPVNTADVLDVKMGWYIYVGNDSYATGPRTIDMTGEPALGNQIIAAPHLANIGDPAEDGWNLIANPYFAPVRWGDVVKTGAYDEAQYKRNDGSNDVMTNDFIIAPGEAFWVHANPGGATITFIRTQIYEDESDDYNLRTASALAETPQLTIELEQGEFKDLCYVGFNTNATNLKDAELDAYKLPHSNPMASSVFTTMNGVELLRNVINTTVDAIIPIHVVSGISQGTEKKYKLKIANINEVLKFNKSIVLEDKLEGTFTNLTSALEIDFSMLDSNKEPRFYLHISTPIVFLSENISCSGANNGLATASLKNNEIAEFVWKNTDGSIIKKELASVSTINNLPVGEFTLEVNGASQLFTVTEPYMVTSDFETYFGDINYGYSSKSSQSDTLKVNVGDVVKFEFDNVHQHNLTWNFGDFASSKENSTNHIYFNKGVYEVKLIAKNGSCESVSYKYIQVDEKFSINQTNLFDEANVIVRENNLNVFMNNNYDGVVSFEVLNSIGQTIYSSSKQIATNHIEEIKLNVASGVYMLKIEGLNNSKTKKIVLN